MNCLDRIRNGLASQRLNGKQPVDEMMVSSRSCVGEIFDSQAELDEGCSVAQSERSPLTTQENQIVSYSPRKDERLVR